MSRICKKEVDIIEDEGKRYLLEVKLDHCHTKIIRQIVVSSATSLDALHMIIQIAMGWTNSHLHIFRTEIGDIGPISEYDSDNHEDESKFFLDEIVNPSNPKFKYEYDFGDGWEHTIKVKSFDYKKIIPHEPFCAKAVGACPPEDVGGVGGYENFCNIINDNTNPDYAETYEWIYSFCGYPKSQKWPDEVNIYEINTYLNEFYLDSEDYKQQETHFLGMFDFMTGEIINDLDDLNKAQKKEVYEMIGQILAVAWNLTLSEKTLPKADKAIKKYIKEEKLPMPEMVLKIMSLAAKIKLENYSEDTLLIEHINVVVKGNTPDIEAFFKTK